jgi:hypothetical protein
MLGTINILIEIKYNYDGGNNNKHIFIDSVIGINVKGIACEGVELIQVALAYLKTLSLHSAGETE